MYNPNWLKEDQQRVIDMDRWDQLDGRHKANHPLHGLYTGLAEKGKALDRNEELKNRMANAHLKLKRAKKN